jgi:hypothetical protein
MPYGSRLWCANFAQQYLRIKVARFARNDICQPVGKKGLAVRRKRRTMFRNVLWL